MQERVKAKGAPILKNLLLQRQTPMEFDDVVQQRRSIRGYLNKPVPQALIREIIALALRAPDRKSVV